MKTQIYYCAMTEFYENGTFKGAVFAQTCKEKPKNTQRTLPFMAAYKDWFASREQAEEFLKKQSTGRAA